MHKDNFTQEGKGPCSRKDTSSFLDVIFKSLYESGEYSEADIRDEINTMVFAGSDTAANTLSFLFLMLATFPDIQNQVYEELYDLYGSSDPNEVPITMEDTKKMKYLDRVIKETLRLFPAAPFIARKLYRDTRGIFTYNKIFFSIYFCPLTLVSYIVIICQKFGMTQMRVIAATLLRKFLVRIDNPVSVENIDLKFRITLQPAETIFLRFNKR
ncbi:cytochrome P450 4V2-like [Polistes fuscatus]|uniref:cytochrome P450 4V2-like n=1 Tax=Polistes fuscatus TaxID=30207 RepID=UPI001CA7D417|nr:cytochrome P450 4V2-like [Polistes fuscatus]